MTHTLNTDEINTDIHLYIFFLLWRFDPIPGHGPLYETNVQAGGGIRTPIPASQRPQTHGLRPRGHQDWHTYTTADPNNSNNILYVI
jgi:hypothetical protein